MKTTFLILSLLSPVLPALPQEPTGPSGRYGDLPVAFEANTGAWPDAVRFVSRSRDFTLFLSAEQQVLRLQDRRGGEAVVTAQFLGGAPSDVRGVGRQPGAVHYYRGNDPASWRTDVPLYDEVRYERVWDGIDVVYHGRRQLLEYDFVVAPGADPGAIRMAFSGARSLEIEADGDLVLHTAAGPVRHQAPVAWQDNDNRRLPVDARWQVEGSEAWIEVGAYDRSLAVVIDPTIVFITHLGGASFDDGSRIEVDAQGCAHIVGDTQSIDFPTQNPFQANRNGTQDLFVTKLSADGSALVYSTYLGGEGSESDTSDIVLLDDGSVAVTGRTSSFLFPVTGGAFQAQKQAGVAAFLSILSPAGALTYSTYYSGSRHESGTAIAFANDRIYIAGSGGSNNLPGVATGFQTQPAGGGSVAPDCFIAAFDRNTGQPVGATFLGGATSVDRALGLDAGPAGVAVTGNTQSTDFPTRDGFQTGFAGGRTDAFVALLSHDLSTLHYSTYLGGRGNEDFNAVTNVRIGPAGMLHVAGVTTSSNFPVTVDALQPVHAGGGSDAYVTRIDPTRVGPASLSYSTYFGGSGLDNANDLRVDGAGNMFFCGRTRSADLPMVLPLFPLEFDDAYVAVIEASGSSLRFCTPIGGADQFAEGFGLALGPGGDVFAMGTTAGLPGLPTTPGAFQPTHGGTGAPSDAWVARLALPFAAANNYGPGLAGTNGIPALDADPPILGTTMDIRIGNSLGAPTAGALLVGFAPSNFPLFGGTLLVFQVLTVPLNVPAAGLVLPVSLPADPSQCGAQLFLQALEFDPGASQNISFSPGLRLDLGI